jgi:uncharacterized protein YuzE
MRDTYLEVTFRKGKIIAAYLYLPRTIGEKVNYTEKISSGVLIDYGDNGRPIGVEITTPQNINMEKINEIFGSLNIETMSEKELAPLLTV